MNNTKLEINNKPTIIEIILLTLLTKYHPFSIKNANDSKLSLPKFIDYIINRASWPKEFNHLYPEKLNPEKFNIDKLNPSSKSYYHIQWRWFLSVHFLNLIAHFDIQKNIKDFLVLFIKDTFLNTSANELKQQFVLLRDVCEESTSLFILAGLFLADNEKLVMMPRWCDRWMQTSDPDGEWRKKLHTQLKIVFNGLLGDVILNHLLEVPPKKNGLLYLSHTSHGNTPFPIWKLLLKNLSFNDIYNLQRALSRRKNENVYRATKHYLGHSLFINQKTSSTIFAAKEVNSELQVIEVHTERLKSNDERYIIRYKDIKSFANQINTLILDDKIKCKFDKHFIEIKGDSTYIILPLASHAKLSIRLFSDLRELKENANNYQLLHEAHIWLNYTKNIGLKFQDSIFYRFYTKLSSTKYLQFLISLDKHFLAQPIKDRTLIYSYICSPAGLNVLLDLLNENPASIDIIAAALEPYFLIKNQFITNPIVYYLARSSYGQKILLILIKNYSELFIKMALEPQAYLLKGNEEKDDGSIFYWLTTSETGLQVVSLLLEKYPSLGKKIASEPEHFLLAKGGLISDTVIFKLCTLEEGQKVFFDLLCKFPELAKTIASDLKPYLIGTKLSSPLYLLSDSKYDPKILWFFLEKYPIFSEKIASSPKTFLFAKNGINDNNTVFYCLASKRQDILLTLLKHQPSLTKEIGLNTCLIKGTPPVFYRLASSKTGREILLFLLDNCPELAIEIANDPKPYFLATVQGKIKSPALYWLVRNTDGHQFLLALLTICPKLAEKLVTEFELYFQAKDEFSNDGSVFYWLCCYGQKILRQLIHNCPKLIDEIALKPKVYFLEKNEFDKEGPAINWLVRDKNILVSILNHSPMLALKVMSDPKTFLGSQLIGDNESVIYQLIYLMAGQEFLLKMAKFYSEFNQNIFELWDQKLINFLFLFEEDLNLPVIYWLFTNETGQALFLFLAKAHSYLIKKIDVNSLEIQIPDYAVHNSGKTLLSCLIPEIKLLLNLSKPEQNDKKIKQSSYFLKTNASNSFWSSTNMIENISNKVKDDKPCGPGYGF